MTRAGQSAVLYLFAAAFAPGAAGDAPRIAVLVEPGPAGLPAVETEDLCVLARRLANAEILLPAAGGGFVDAGGKPAAVERFAAVWCYRGPPVTGKDNPWAPQVAALRRFAAAGGGLLLAGGAVGLVGPLGAGAAEVEPVRFGDDRGRSAGGCRQRPAAGSTCRPRPSGNTPAGRAAPRLSGTAPRTTTLRPSPTAPINRSRRSTRSGGRAGRR